MSPLTNCLGYRKADQVAQDFRSGKLTIGPPMLQPAHQSEHFVLPSQTARGHSNKATTVRNRCPPEINLTITKASTTHQCVAHERRHRVQFGESNFVDIDSRKGDLQQSKRTGHRPVSEDIALARRDTAPEIIPPSLVIMPGKHVVDKYSEFRHVTELSSGGEGSVSIVRLSGTKQLFACKTVKKPEMIYGKTPRGKRHVHLLQAVDLPTYRLIEVYVIGHIAKHRKRHPHIIDAEAWWFNESIRHPIAEYYLPYFPLGDLGDFAYRHFDRKESVPEMFIFQVSHPTQNLASQ